jgi:hypothetical protein
MPWADDGDGTLDAVKPDLPYAEQAGLDEAQQAAALALALQQRSAAVAARRRLTLHRTVACSGRQTRRALRSQNALPAWRCAALLRQSRFIPAHDLFCMRCLARRTPTKRPRSKILADFNSMAAGLILGGAHPPVV